MKKIIFSLFLLLLLSTTGFSKGRLAQSPLGNKITSSEKVFQNESKLKQSNLPVYLIDTSCGTWTVISEIPLNIFDQLRVANYINNNYCNLPFQL
ncbi:MAG: hypothetical protein NTZ19_13265 [Bacteroidetes bacterium]|nr:hypothetical protein [Bacteroidota bacterium]